MKVRNILFALVLGAACAASAQDSFKPGVKYVADATDSYAMKMSMTTQMGDLAISMDVKQTVKKVYDNGDADIESAISNMLVNMAGQEIRPPAQPATVSKVNKFGVPLGNPQGGRAGGMNFARFGTYFGDKELKVGETSSFDQADKDKPKNHVKGSVKLVKIEGGKATFEVAADNYMENSEKPMHIAGTTVVDVASGKMDKFMGKATDLPAQQGMTIASAQFSMERKG